MNPYVFVVGCARSGTTLVQRLLDAHPRLAMMHGTRWIARWFEAERGVGADGCVTAGLVEELIEHPRFGALEIEPPELWALYERTRGASYAAFVTALFDRFGERHSKPLVGDKTPEYAQSLATLSRLWPTARFVHVVRDGRDVYLSVRDWRKGAAKWPSWPYDAPGTAAAWWDLNVRLAREAGADLGPRLYHEVRYEELVADPRVACDRMCSFLGIDYDESMLAFHAGRPPRSMSVEPRTDAKRSWLPVTAGLRDWRRDMSRADLRRFETVSGDLLAELGYERGDAARDAPPASAGSLRLTYLDLARPRRRRVPLAWRRGAA